MKARDHTALPCVGVRAVKVDHFALQRQPAPAPALLPPIFGASEKQISVPVLTARVIANEVHLLFNGRHLGHGVPEIIGSTSGLPKGVGDDLAYGPDICRVLLGDTRRELAGRRPDGSAPRQAVIWLFGQSLVGPVPTHLEAGHSPLGVHSAEPMEARDQAPHPGVPLLDRAGLQEVDARGGVDLEAHVFPSAGAELRAHVPNLCHLGT
jgi:hypothetical protein